MPPVKAVAAPHNANTRRKRLIPKYEAYLHSRSQRLYGPQRIKAELRERGIADEIIAVVFAEADIDWYANKQQLLQNKFGAQSATDFSTIDFKERAKRLRFLQYRGFSTEFGTDVDL